MALATLASGSWWQTVLVVLALLVGVFGGGALLCVGGRFIAKSPKATYWRSVATVLLTAVAGWGALAIVILIDVAAAPTNPAAFVVAALVGLAAALLVTWLIIAKMFKISFGRAILAWLPTLVTSIICIGLLMTAMPWLPAAQEMSPRAVCASKLGQLSLCVRAAQNTTTGTSGRPTYPSDIRALFAVCPDPEVFSCPSDESGRLIDYFYSPPQEPFYPSTILICEYAGHHLNEGRNVLRLDGSIHLLTESQFQAELALPVNAAFAAALRQAEAVDPYPAGFEE